MAQTYFFCEINFLKPKPMNLRKEDLSGDGVKQYVDKWVVKENKDWRKKNYEARLSNGECVCSSNLIAIKGKRRHRMREQTINQQQP